MNVIKRNGESHVLDIEKIHAVVRYACEGLDVSESEVEMNASIMFFDGIKTSQIHESLIKSASELISEEAPDYTFVAARLVLQVARKEANDSRTDYKSLGGYIHEGVKEGRLTSDLLHGFNFEALDEAIEPERDLQFTYLGMTTIVDRYLIRRQPSRGQKDGDLIEMPQHMFMRIAMGLALNEKVNRTEWAISFYNILSSFEFMSSTPTLFNSGTNHAQMSSCYLNTVADKISADAGEHPYASIFGTMEECANLSKWAGGIGTDWTNVRPSGDLITGTNGKSSGIVPYLKIFNDTAVAVNQCHTPETLIQTVEGIKRIDSVVVGDLVLGERGKFREVLEVLSYSQSGKPMVSIDVKHSVKPMNITSGHPVYAIQGIAMEQSVTKTMKQIEAGKFFEDWVEAGNLKVGDYAAQVIPSEVKPVVGFTEDDAHLYGIMLGDGHCSKRNQENAHRKVYETKEWGVTGLPDEDSIIFVKQYLEERGIHHYVTETPVGKAIQIKWSQGGKQQLRDEAGQFGVSENCMPFDYDDLYDENHKKRISRKFNSLPPVQTLRLLQGLIESDGCVSRGVEITFTNTSEKLAEGVRYQCLRLGVPTAGQIREKSNTHLAGDSLSSIVWDIRIPAFEELAVLVKCKSLTKKNWLTIDNKVFSRIKSVESLSPVDTVYDLIVEGDETYMTTSALVHNGGKRNGAFAAYLEPWHGDFMRFCDLKKNAGDERLRAREIFTACWTNDLFMERVRDEKEWSFFSPKDCPLLHGLYGEAFKVAYERYEELGLAIRTMPAKEVWRHWLAAMWESGGPWVTFKDEANRRNPQAHIGTVNNSNLCTEITLVTSNDETAVCNLGSINASKVNSLADLERVVPIAMRMLDNVIDLNFYPSDRARNSNLRHRPVGLGVMGWTEYVVKNGVDWESQEHMILTNQFFEKMSFEAIKASCNLAIERGAYPTFAGSTWSQGILPIDTARELPFISKETKLDWDGLREAVMAYGMRNSNTMAIAPTATIANIVGTTPCIEPIYERVYPKENHSGLFTVVDSSLKYGRPDLCKESFEIDQEWVIKAAAVRQRWLDQAQSTNLFAKIGTKGSDLNKWFFLAWEYGLKTTYYLRRQVAQTEERTAGTSVISEVLVSATEEELLEAAEGVMCSLDSPDCESCQ